MMHRATRSFTATDGSTVKAGLTRVAEDVLSPEAGDRLSDLAERDVLGQPTRRRWDSAFRGAPRHAGRTSP